MSFPLCFLGEGPHWNAEKQELIFVDIDKDGIVYRYKPLTRALYKVNIGSDNGSASFVIPVQGSPNKYVVSLSKSLHIMEWNGVTPKPSKVEKIGQVDPECPGNRFNDAKCDKNGILWAGTMGSEEVATEVERSRGSFYSVDSSGAIQKHFSQIDISNGLCWSKDGQIMYYIDSLIRGVEAFDVKGGQLSNRRIVFDFEKKGVVGFPDGMSIDSEGNLWIAVFAGSSVIKVNPNSGELLDRIQFPSKNITSVTFGGENLDKLYVTSARHGHTLEELSSGQFPEAGATYEVSNLGVQGQSGGVAFKWAK